MQCNILCNIVIIITIIMGCCCVAKIMLRLFTVIVKFNGLNLMEFVRRPPPASTSFAPIFDFIFGVFFRLNLNACWEPKTIFFPLTVVHDIPRDHTPLAKSIRFYG